MTVMGKQIWCETPWHEVQICKIVNTCDFEFDLTLPYLIFWLKPKVVIAISSKLLQNRAIYTVQFYEVDPISAI
jgi:hypothetical protein